MLPPSPAGSPSVPLTVASHALCGACLLRHQAAQAAGMQAVGVSWGAHGEAQLFGLFDSVVADVGALREALRTMGVAGAAEQTKTNA